MEDEDMAEWNVACIRSGNCLISELLGADKEPSVSRLGLMCEFACSVRFACTTKYTTSSDDGVEEDWNKRVA